MPKLISGSMQSLITLLAFVFLMACQTDMSSIKKKYLDLAYAQDSKAQTLDIFIPEGEGPFPAVMLIHGGGFKFGDKSSEYSLAKYLLAHGYVAVTINYRLSGEAKFPAAVHDCKAALRFLRGNAQRYAIQEDKIATWGASAGGNLSAMMGTSAGDDFADGQLGDFPTKSTRIQACIDWFGPINFAQMIPEAQVLGFKEGFDVAIESAYLGADASDPKQAHLVKQANPSSYIDKNDPPFYVQAGDQDANIPYLQSKHFSDTLAKVLGDDKVTFELIQGGKHGGAKFTKEENLAKILTFLDKHLK